MKRPNPWFTAAALALAAGVPYLTEHWASQRLVSAAQLKRLFVDPLHGHPGVRLWEPTQAPILPLGLEAPSSAALDPQAMPSPEPSETPSASSGFAPLPVLKDGETPLPSGPMLEDPSNALKPFLAALARAEAGQGQVRISHFGDSPVTGDLITGEARARFQKLAGNAGHGWILPGRPWEWYGHLGVNLEAKGWRMHNAATSPQGSGDARYAYGMGGVSFSSSGGATTKLSTVKGMPFNHLELHFMARPRGGTVQVKVDDAAFEISTAASEAQPAKQIIAIPSDQNHSVTLKAKGDGEVTLFGLVMERDAPGVVYDAVGINGGAIHHLTLANAGAWIASLKLRRPDLVILAFGTNEAGYANIPGPGYEADYREMVRRIRAALPSVSILMMAPMDRDERNRSGQIGTMPSIPKIVETQRKLARELGCAFFDTFHAMGGPDASLHWYKADPRLMTGDFTHPTRTGADHVARLLVDALRAQKQGGK